MEEKRNKIFEAITSLGAGIVSYIIVAPFIPKEWSFLPRLQNKSVLSGFLNGFGNVRNTLSTSVGILAMLFTESNFERKYQQKLRKSLDQNSHEPATQSLALDLDQSDDKQDDKHMERASRPQVRDTTNAR